MRTFTAAAILAVALVGCNKSVPGGGAEADGKHFQLSAPATATTVKQGETRVIQVDVRRDKDFTEEVTLKTESPANTGVTAELVNTNSRSSDAKVELRVTATSTAVLGSYKIRVIGTPSKGNATEVMVPVTIDASPATK